MNSTAAQVADVATSKFATENAAKFGEFVACIVADGLVGTDDLVQIVKAFDAATDGKPEAKQEFMAAFFAEVAKA